MYFYLKELKEKIYERLHTYVFDCSEILGIYYKEVGNEAEERVMKCCNYKEKFGGKL